MKTLLVLGAGRLNLPALSQMSKVVRVIALDKCPYQISNSPSLRTFSCDFSDTENLLQFLTKYKFDGVYPMNDHAILPAALVSEKFNTRILNYKTSDVLLDKSKMRRIWNENNLSQPKYQIVSNLLEAKSAADTIGFPLIIKPSASGGAGRGVYKISCFEELNIYFPQVLAECRYSTTILVEQFIEGIESSLEVIFIRRKAYLLAVSSKEKAPGCSQVATQIVYPAQVSEDCIINIFNLSERAGLALGITDGVGHFEVISDSSGIPYLIEVGGRAGGGHTFHPIVSHVSGINYPQLIAHLYTGNYHEVERLLRVEIESNSAIYSFPVADKTGEINKIGFNILPSKSCFTECWRKKGDFIDGMNSSMDRLGCLVLLSDKDASAAIRESRNIMSKFHLELI